MNPPEGALASADVVDAAPRIIRNHRRFALTDVTFEGVAVGGATIDAWQTGTGAECWAARVLMPATDLRTAGTLTGRARDGRILRGQVSLAAPGPEGRPRGAILVEWHGVGRLVADAPAAEGPKTA